MLSTEKSLQSWLDLTPTCCKRQKSSTYFNKKKNVNLKDNYEI